jgi:anti-anti-sigma regulatory factor
VEVPVDVAERGAGSVRAVTLHDASLAHDLRALRSNVAEVLRTRPESVLVDVSELTRPSSSVVAALRWAKRSCARGGVGFSVQGVGSRNGEVLRRCGLFVVPVEEER